LSSKILKFVFGRGGFAALGPLVGTPYTPTGGGEPPLLLFDFPLLLENEWNALHRVKNTQNFHILYLFFPKTKKTSLLRGPPQSKMSYFFTIKTGDKFVIYVPIRRYGDFNTLQ
jgi:hypothetical protein